jgi:hypothetical protein
LLDIINQSHSFSLTGNMEFHLQNLLDKKGRQLEQAATLGQRVLAQQLELEERIRQLQETEDLQSKAEKSHELTETVTTWDHENEKLFKAFGVSVSRLSLLSTHHGRRVMSEGQDATGMHLPLQLTTKKREYPPCEISSNEVLTNRAGAARC